MPSDDEIHGLPAGRELDAVVLAEVLGWRWMRNAARRDTNRCAFYPPEPVEWGVAGQWEPTNYVVANMVAMAHWPSDGERLDGWDRACVRNDHRGRWDRTSMPRPSSDHNDFATVRRHLAGLGWYGEHTHWFPDDKCPTGTHGYQFVRSVESPEFIDRAEVEFDPDELVAGCRAALAAVRRMEEVTT